MLRDGSGQNLRDYLITTAARLIDQRGSAGLAVRDITREAKVADGVLYNYFEDKEDLLAHALLAHVGNVMASAPQLLPPPGEGHGEGEDAAGGEDHREGYGLPDLLSAYLRAEQRLGRLDPAADVDAATSLVVGAIHGQILPRVLFAPPGGPITIPPGLAARLADTVLAGIAPRPRP